MTWDFTPAQVMKGEVDYGFDDFRRDFFDQVRFNFGDQVPPERLEEGFNLFWVICHLTATMKSLDEIEQKLSEVKPSLNRGLLELMYKTYQEDAHMLAAIYQNLFLKYFESSLRDSWGNEDKATSEAIALLNLYINRHLQIPISDLISGGTPHKRSLPI